MKTIFNATQIEALRAEFAKVEAVPFSRVAELQNKMDSLADDMLAQLAKAKIKFISGLALNRCVRRGIKIS